MSTKEYHTEYYQKHKEASKDRSRRWRVENKERANARDKEYNEQNKDKIREQRKKFREANKDRLRKLDRKKYLRTREAVIKRVTEYNKNNPKRSEYMLAYQKKRMKEDIQFRLRFSIRNRLRCAIKQQRIFKRKVSNSAIVYLGCSIEDFKRYLETKFEQKMTWDNYGTGAGTWQLDHIKPLSAFDLTKQDQLIEVCNYSNYQPLWTADNLKKGNRISVSSKEVFIRN